MPHPDHLERYEQILPGSAAMIFEEFQAQAKHRRELEALVVKNSETRANRGQIIGTCALFIAIISGFAAILIGYDWTGAALIALALGSAAFVYIVGGAPGKRSDD